MTVEIETYLRGRDGVFTRIAEYDAPIRDPDYVEGAIRMSIDGQEIVGVAEWDDVNWLWPFLATMAADLADSERVATSYPSQPIGLSFTRKGTFLEVAVDYVPTRVAWLDGLPRALPAGRVRRRGLAPALEFLTALQTAGWSYAAEMSRLGGVAFTGVDGDLRGLTGLLDQDWLPNDRA
ncbi:hypothetical protein D0T12_18300 [Actinomadura spongiicola]|uniref:Uncharacterized protein n=1 Tax=Actinomadura spongiicola TaxID=2303421 RepID=A0A372GFZ0_9ACTN|nr:hypothetical protein [Actinomadura spongiicola]RFS84112.1 hypothetical protein D0T12_18300 [Actinomadura spongiicola]